MKQFSICTTSLIITAIILSSVSSFNITSTTLLDLQATNSSFSSDANLWSFSSLASSTQYSLCGSVYLLGGYGISGPSGSSTLGQSLKRTYRGLPTHSSVVLTMNVYLLDAWAVTDSVQITVINGTTITLTNYNYVKFTTAKCGSSSYNDLGPIKASTTFAHSSSSMIIEISSGLAGPSTTKSFGIRDVNITFLNAAVTTSACTTNSTTCLPCGNSQNPQCYQCSANTFLTSSHTCSPCSASCGTCYGSTSSSCLSCPPGQFMINNNTCIATCADPLTSVTDGLSSYCTSRCSSGQFLYWDGDCSSTCPSPLVGATISTFKQCTYPCTDSQYLYWNLSCLATCSFPLKSRVERGKNYCDYPCSTTDFLHFDGTCSSQCPAPLVPKTEASKKYCNKACPNYLNWKKTCQDSCDAPFRASIENKQDICKLPCDNSTYYFYKDYGTCDQYCIEPFVPQDHTVYQECSISSSVLEVILQAPEPGTTTFVTVFKSLNYIRYLDINLPPRLRDFTRSQGRNVLSLKPYVKIPAGIASQFTNHTLPSAFQNRGLHSSFLLNFWNDMLSLGGILIIIIVLGLVEKVFQVLHLTTFHAFVQKFSLIFRWNVFLLTIVYYLDDIILYSVLEFSTLSQGSKANLTFVGFCLGIIFLAIGLGALFGAYLLVRMARVARFDSAKEKSAIVYAEFVRSWQGCQILFRGVNFSGTYKRNFYLLYAVRMAFPTILTVFLSKLPLVNCTVQTIINVLIILYVAYMKPLKKKVNQVQILLFEVLCLATNVLIFFMISYSLAATEKSLKAVLIGDAIIIMNDLINLLVLIFLPIKFVIELRAMCRHLSQYPDKSGLAYIELLSLIFQQGAMGFEEMIQDTYTRDLVDSGASKVSLAKVQPLHRRIAILPEKKTTVKPQQQSPIEEGLSAASTVAGAGSDPYLASGGGGGSPLKKLNRNENAPLINQRSQRAAPSQSQGRLQNARALILNEPNIYLEDPRAVENARRNIADYRKQVMSNKK